VSTAASELSILIQKESVIAAPAKIVFDSILTQIGPEFTQMDGKAQPLKLEAWPGGRWFRDLGHNTGHFWAHVQVIKPPTLLELYGPMFMSYAAINHVQWRVTEAADGKSSTLKLIHRCLAEVSPEHREGMHKGWEYIVSKIAERARR
jgi:uncharacterized protein YndB with AHSA1/START domain